jgi:hypothetical protein
LISQLDVDIVADMRFEHIAPLVAVLSTEFYADDEMMRDAIKHHSSFNLIHYETAFKVDVFIRIKCLTKNKFLFLHLTITPS